MSDQHLMYAGGMIAPSIIKPYRPKGKPWYPTKVDPRLPMVHRANAVEIWQHPDGFTVISALEMATDKEGSAQPAELHYHLSISKHKARCSSSEARWVLKQFRCHGAEEDNHVPDGFVRNFWRPVNENNVGRCCPCVATEPEIREDKGDFVWRPAD